MLIILLKNMRIKSDIISIIKTENLNKIKFVSEKFEKDN